MAANLKKIVFYAPQLAPERSTAAAIRCRSIVDQLQQLSGAEVVLYSEHNLFLRMASNKSPLFVRLICEILLGVELALRLLLLKITQVLHSEPQPLVVFSSPPYVTCLIGAFACQITNLKYALDIRDPYPEVYFNQNIFSRDSLLGQIQTNLARQFYNQSEQIFTVTDGCKKMIENYLQEATPTVEVVRNGYVSPHYNFHVLKRPQFTCVFHGNLGYLQNISLLKSVIETTAQSNPAIRFVVAGTGPQEQLLKQIQTTNFEFLGEVEHHLIPKLLKSCHVGLSFRDESEYSDIAFPVKIYEYIGADLPILSSPKSPTVLELETKKMAYLFNNDDVEKIVGKICEWAEQYKNSAKSNLAEAPAAHEGEYLQYVHRIAQNKNEYSRDAGAKKFAEIIKRKLTII